MTQACHSVGKEVIRNSFLEVVQIDSTDFDKSLTVRRLFCLSGIDVDVAVEHRGKQKKCKKGRKHHGQGGWWGFGSPYGPHGGNFEPFGGQGQQSGTSGNSEGTKQADKSSSQQKTSNGSGESEPMVIKLFLFIL